MLWKLRCWFFHSHRGLDHNQFQSFCPELTLNKGTSCTLHNSYCQVVRIVFKTLFWIEASSHTVKPLSIIPVCVCVLFYCKNCPYKQHTITLDALFLKMLFPPVHCSVFLVLTRTIPRITVFPEKIVEVTYFGMQISTNIIIIFNYALQPFKAYCAIWVRRSNFRHQVPPCMSPRKSAQRRKVELWGRNVR